MSESIISIKGLSVNYDSKRVLTNIYLELDGGHVYGVLGPNGAGKSTLFKSILGLIEYSAGAITVFGKDIAQVRKRIAYVPQKDEIDWTFPVTVKDVVIMGRYPHKRILKRINNEDLAIVDHAMEEVGIIDLANRQIGNLSGGQQQRVFIARALAQQADLFFFDEPFAGIDITSEEKIVTIMSRLASEGKTMLVVHHDISTVPKYFSKVILINQRLIACGITEDAFTKENIAACYGAQLTILHKSGLVNR
jgi:ABC-type Mn2+/Zn2+ transport system ATPase subunit